MTTTEPIDDFYNDENPINANAENDFQSEILKAALNYYKQGLSIAPLKNFNKSPNISWKKYQKERASIEDIKKWFSEPDITGIAIITGKISGIAVLDVEKEGLEKLKEFKIPDTIYAKSGGGGMHFYFKYSPKIKTVSAILPKMDTRSEGGLIVAPPSKHKSGAQYEWVNSFDTHKLAEVPNWLNKTTKKDKKTPLKQEIVKEGERNSTAARWAGKFLNQCKIEEYDTKAWDNLKRWNRKYCIPPLEEDELKKVHDSIKEHYFESENAEDEILKGEGGISQKDLIQLLLLRIEPFTDQFNEAYVKAEINGCFRVMRCKSESFSEFINLFHWKETGNPLSPEQIKKIVQNISAIAKFESEKINLYTRVAEKDGTYYYDLGNDKSEVVKIENDIWEITTETPTLFRKYQSQKAQLQPMNTGGDIKNVLKYLNLKTEEDRLLFMVYLVSCFIPEIPHPIGIVHGLKGSAKSTLSKVVKTIVDPSPLEITTFPKDEENLVQTLDHHWLVYFDNLTRLRQWGSDAICRAVTGGGLAKRQLYTDDSDKIYNFKRCVGLNGINIVANKPDLLDRSITFELEPISEEKRLTEREFWRNFYEDLPSILGGIFDTLAKAKNLLPTIKLTKKPRMADFAEHGCAIAMALGYPQLDFENAYKNNRKQQNETVLNEDIVASTVIKFMEDKEEWIGKASELYIKLSDLNDGKIKGFPGAPNVLSNQLRTVKMDLEECGIEVDFIKDCKGFRGRGIEIRKASPPSSLLSQQENDNASNETKSDNQNDDTKNIPSQEPSQRLQIEEEVESKNDDNDDTINYIPVDF